MIINRYVSPVDSVYNPMSFQELAFAPTFLRQKHDQAAQSLSDLELASQQYDVLNGYQPIATQLTQPLTQDIETLAEQLAKQGVTGSRAIPEAMKLKSQYSQLFSPTGGIGQLQSATKQYRTRAEELKKQYEDNPLLQQYALSQLRPGEAVLQDGRVQLGNMQDARMVRHIAEEDILDRLNKAASDLKPSDLGRSGIQYTGQLGSFNDLYSIAQKQGVSFDRVDALVKSMLSGEEQLSLAQFARATGQDPEKALENFRNKMTGIAATNATSTTSFRDFNVTDELSLANAKKVQELQTQGINNWEYDPTSQEVSVGGLDDSYFEPTDVDLYSPSDRMAMFQGPGAVRMPARVTKKEGKTYKPFNDMQKIDAYNIISFLTGEPVEKIPEDFINSSKGRSLLKEYYSKNKGKLSVQPTINTSNYLREYGGDPEKATKDLYDNYQNRAFFDVEEGRELTTKEFEDYLSKGKLQVKGEYTSQNSFAKLMGNIDPSVMSSPLTVNLKDDNGRVIKRFAVSRNPAFIETQYGKEALQNNTIFNEVFRLPGIPKKINYNFISPDGKFSLGEVPIEVSYNVDKKSFSVKSLDSTFKDFETDKLNNLSTSILENRK